jgi:hypothetical protein
LRPSLAIPPGGSCRLSIAGLTVEIAAKLTMKSDFELPGDLASFETPPATPDVSLVVDSRPSVGATTAPAVYDSGLNWLLREESGRRVFESYHIHQGLLVSAATQDSRRYDVLFHEENWERIWSLTRGDHPGFQLPYPMHQLVLLAPLARESGFLLHASGAVIDGQAFVFAGHSGDGKTTLSRLLAAEGLELLSDERIALRKQGHGFRAYGTPWPGEGEIISSASYPLGGVFILRKADRHRVREGRPSLLAAELLSRAIVPYYFGRETRTILGLVHDLATSTPLRELEFSLSDGLLPVLASAA